MIKILMSCLLLTLTSVTAFGQRNKIEVVTDKVQLEALKAAVEKSIDSPAVHDKYIHSMGIENPELVKQYDVWMQQYPTSAMVPYALGLAYKNMESPKAKPYLEKAVALNPKFSEAWGALWIDAERWGDFEAGRAYLAKAVAANPADPNYTFYHASSFSGVDEAKYKTLSLAVAKKFPQHERGAQALYWLGSRAKNVKDKLAYFELLRNSYAPNKFNWSASGMSSYYDLLLTANPEKALALAQDMAKDPDNAKEWNNLTLQAEQVVAAKNFLIAQQAEESLTALSKIKLPRYFTFNKDLLLLKANAQDMAGRTNLAYDSLIIAFAKAPATDLKTAISTYGKKLGKNAEQVTADIWKRLDANAQVATPFNLKRYDGKGSTALADYKGKVVLLTYWFPGCGPCRGEFPHFQNVVNKFKGRNLEYVGINIVSDQNDYVVPFMKSSGYSFTPLEDVKGRVKGNLDNRNAAPMNFLIDQEGRLIFANFRTDGDNEDDLELMINMLLTPKKS
ncbi:redoxin domain-containing protein [Pedobacter insulae]|uniref:Peroxiredoxin n=1 Tax=Pedobacter insulae TaxID=414048 RepID=A0A1I2THC4_9SPHI|nr:redoxin domain-containing protein [Pedobacter insulae]SFG61936.1 Peroxiredoxin [Pedobacter insulae]